MLALLTLRGSGLGILGALVYAVGRGWFPVAWRPWIAAAFFGLVGGAGLLKTDGIDFRALEPLSLAVVMFVAIPTVGGFVIALWIERWLASDHVPRSRAGALWPLIGFLAIGPIGIAMLVVLVAGWSIVQAVPWLGSIWRSEPVTWIGRALVAGGAVLGAIALARDVTEILGS